MRSTHAARRLLATIVTFAVQACGTSAPPAQSPAPRAQSPAQIVVPGNYEGSGVGIHHTRPGGAYTFGGLTICLDKPGRAVIEKVYPVDAYGGLTVEAFAVIPNPHERGMPGFGELDVTIDELRRTGAGLDPPVLFGGDPTVLDRPCVPPSVMASPLESEPHMKKLLIQFTKAGNATAGDKATAIQYTSDGERFELIVPYYVVLCGPDDTSLECAR